MNKILLIIRREFLTRIRKTSFIVLTLLMPFLFVGIIATPVLLSRIGNDETARQIAVIDPTGRYAAAFKPRCTLSRSPVDSVLRPNYKAADSPFEAVVEIRGDLSQHPDALSISGAKEVQPRPHRLRGKQPRRSRAPRKTPTLQHFRSSMSLSPTCSAM